MLEISSQEYFKCAFFKYSCTLSFHEPSLPNTLYMMKTKPLQTTILQSSLRPTQCITHLSDDWKDTNESMHSSQQQPILHTWLTFVAQHKHKCCSNLELSQCYSANVSLSSFLIVVVVEGLLGVDTVWFTCKQSTDITSNSYQTHHSDYIVVWPFKHPSHCLIILHILHQFFLHSFVINHTLLLTPLTSSPCIPCFFIYPDSRSMNAAQTFFIVSCHVSYKTYTPW